jgi:hypothetical protein
MSLSSWEILQLVKSSRDTLYTLVYLCTDCGRLAKISKHILSSVLYYILLYNDTQDFFYDYINLSKCVLLLLRKLCHFIVVTYSQLSSSKYDVGVDTHQCSTCTGTTGIRFFSRSVRLIFSVNNVHNFIVLHIYKYINSITNMIKAGEIMVK